MKKKPSTAKKTVSAILAGVTAAAIAGALVIVPMGVSGRELNAAKQELLEGQIGTAELPDEENAPEGTDVPDEGEDATVESAEDAAPVTPLAPETPVQTSKGESREVSQAPSSGSAPAADEKASPTTQPSLETTETPAQKQPSDTKTADNAAPSSGPEAGGEVQGQTGAGKTASETQVPKDGGTAGNQVQAATADDAGSAKPGTPSAPSETETDANSSAGTGSSTESTMESEPVPSGGATQADLTEVSEPEPTPEITAEPEPEPVPEPETPAVTASLCYEILDLMNAERAKEGLEPISWAGKLDDGVLVRAVEANELWSHTRPDGRSCWTAYSGACREIIAWNGTPASAVQAWMASTAGHREAILDPTVKSVSCARAGYIFVAAFSR